MSKTDPDIETRMTVFNRDHGRCFICGRFLSAYAFNLHHRRIHQHPKESYANGWLVSAYNDAPVTVSVRSEYRNADYILDNLGGCYPL